MTTVVTIVSENNHLSVNNDQQEWSNESGQHSQSETSPGATTQPINSWRDKAVVSCDCLALVWSESGVLLVV